MLKERLQNACEMTDLGAFDGIEDTLLLSVPNGEKIGGLFLLDKGRFTDLNQFYCSGLWLDEGRLFWSIQHTDHFRCICLEPSGERWQLINTQISDVHDIRMVDGEMYVVSTGTNEIVTLSEEGIITRRWPMEGMADAWHLNCLDVWDQRVVVCCFGKFENHRGYKGKADNKGIVFDLLTGDILWSGLCFPHTPRIDTLGRKIICDSKYGKLQIDHGNGKIQEMKFLGSFTRGLAITPKYIYVGLSSLRHRTDSYRTKDTILSAAIAVLDFSTLEHLRTVSLPVRQIYDILLLPED